MIHSVHVINKYNNKLSQLVYCCFWIYLRLVLVEGIFQNTIYFVLILELISIYFP